MPYYFLLTAFISFLPVKEYFGQQVIGSGYVLSNFLNSNSTTSLMGAGMGFAENKGQIADMNGKSCPDVLYKGNGGGADVYLRKTGISYVCDNIGEVMHLVNERVEELIKTGKITEADEQKKKDELLQIMSLRMHRVDMDFEGANTNCRLFNDEELEGYQNFYYGHCPQGIANVHQYNKVTYKDIYTNIDVAYDGRAEHGLKYDIIVQPHGDPNQIKLHWRGADNIHLTREGNLIIKTSVNEFYESIPKVYQIINGEIIDVKAKYVLVPISKGEVIINFSFSTYNSSLPLIIDPWATYFGGNQTDYGAGIATDNVGNVVITGRTTGALPFTALGAQVIFGGNLDAFVVKLSSTGAMIWATYYGGNQWDQGNCIATDNMNNIIITGRTDGAFPVAGASVQPVFGGVTDAFVVKFTPAGVIVWATYYGGNNQDYGNGITADKANNIIITGRTDGAFPVTASSAQPVFGGSGLADAFVVKLTPTGVVAWATYYGGNQWDDAYGIDTDNSNNIFITGYTYGAFPVGSVAGNIVQQPVYGGNSDAFVVKFDPAGVMQWATYIGGNQIDFGISLVTDISGNVVIAGENRGAFPVGSVGVNVVAQPVFGGGIRDAFICKFNPVGVRQWATYYGGNQDDLVFVNALTSDVNSNIYLLLEGEDVAAPSLIDACSYQPVFNGGSSVNIPGNHTEVEDQLIVKFSSIGKKLCSTYLGGTGEDDQDYGGGIAIFGNTLYITGSTDGGYPTTIGTAQPVFGGGTLSLGWDAFVASVCTNICEAKTLGIDFTANTTASACVPIKFTPKVNNVCDTTGYKFHWVFIGGTPGSSDSLSPTINFPAAGSYDVKIVVTTMCKSDSITKKNYITVNNCCTLTGQFIKGTASCTSCGCKEWIMVAATGGTAPYNYSWPGGYNKRYQNKLCPGNYTINIIDKNGCSVNVSLTAP